MDEEKLYEYTFKEKEIMAHLGLNGKRIVSIKTISIEQSDEGIEKLIITTR